MFLRDFLKWSCKDGMYHTLQHCMGHDIPWIFAYAISNLLVFIPYVLIARSFLVSFFKNKKSFKELSIADKVSLGMAVIFLLCGFLGYAFDLIRIWIPAYKLIAILKAGLGILSFFTVFYINKINFFQTYYQIEKENQRLKIENVQREREYLQNKKEIEELSLQLTKQND